MEGRAYVRTYVYAGVGTREGVPYQRVYVDDGPEAVGAVDELVSQTTHLHGHLGACLSNPNESMYVFIHIMYGRKIAGNFGG